MNKADQDEYMKLSNKYENIQALPMKEKSELRILLEQRKAQCETNLEQNSKMLKIFHIYETNSFQDCGVCIKISRFNHSCRPRINLAINLFLFYFTFKTEKRNKKRKEVMGKKIKSSYAFYSPEITFKTS